MNSVEEKRNKLNLELRELLSVINMIDGFDFQYENYNHSQMTEEEFLDKQIILAFDAKNRLLDIFRKK